MLARILILIAALQFAGIATHADEWMVQRVANRVAVSTDGKTWTAATPGQAITDGSWVKTGPRGRVILARGDERIVYRANSLAAISKSQTASSGTRVTQQRGSVLMSVSNTRRQRTSVVTPHLAAVVKGTVFEVTVDPRTSRVRVDEGVVEVSDTDERVVVMAGNVATSNNASLTVVPVDFSNNAADQPDLVDRRSSHIPSAATGGTADNSTRRDNDLPFDPGPFQGGVNPDGTVQDLGYGTVEDNGDPSIR